MTVSDLISILQQHDPAAVVVQLDMQSTKRHRIMKLARGDVAPVWVTGKEDLGLVRIELANKDDAGAVQGLLLGEVLC